MMEIFMNLFRKEHPSGLPSDLINLLWEKFKFNKTSNYGLRYLINFVFII